MPEETVPVSPAASGDAQDVIPKVLPVLPLSDVVLFPAMVAPLVVTTAKSIRLIDSVVSGNRFLITVLQKNRAAQDDEVVLKDLHEYGCVARLIKMLKFPDETVRILVQGISRCRISRAAGEQAFPRGPLRGAEGRDRGLGRGQRAAAERLPAVPGNHHAVAGAAGGAEDRGLQHRGPRQAGGPDRVAPEHDARGAAGAAGGSPPEVAAEPAGDPAEPRAGGPAARDGNPAQGQRDVFENPARVFPARADEGDQAGARAKRTSRRSTSRRSSRRSRRRRCRRRLRRPRRRSRTA